MIEVQIGDETRVIADAPANWSKWINEQIVNRRRANVPVCVRVHIQKGQLDTWLITPDCPSSGGRHPADPSEHEIYDLWKRHRLNQPDFTGGNLVAFLRQIT